MMADGEPISEEKQPHSESDQSFKIAPERTNRGFALVKFKDRYNQDCSLQKSSLASEEAIWFGVDKDLEGKDSSRMHLTQDQVLALLPYLKQFAETGNLELPEDSKPK